MVDSPSRREEIEVDHFYDNVSNGIWSPRLKERRSILDKWARPLLKASFLWTFFLILEFGLYIIWRAIWVRPGFLLSLIIVSILSIGVLSMVIMIYDERKFQRSFGLDHGVWFFTSLHSKQVPVDELLDSAEEYLTSLGLKIVSTHKGSSRSGSRFLKLNESPLMIVLSYELGRCDMHIDVEIGPQTGSFKEEMVRMMGHIRDWSVTELSTIIGDLGPDPRDPGTVTV